MKRVLLAGAVVWLLLRMQGFIPLVPIHNSWTMEKDFQGGKIPSYPGVTGTHVARSTDGILVGVGMPGRLDWRFTTSGPFPSTFRPAWEPNLGTNSAIRLILPASSPPRLIRLSTDLPLRYTAFNLQPYLKGQSEYRIRFEGQNSILQGIHWYQSSDHSPTWLPLVIILAGLFMACPWKPMPLTVCALAAVGLILRWHIFFNYFAVPLEGDAAGFWQIARSWSLLHPFATRSHEPVYIWLLSTARMFFGDSERSARFMGCLLSSAIIGMVFSVGRKLNLSFWAAGFAAGLSAMNPFSIFMSVQAYQLEFFTLLILLFAWTWLEGKPLWIGLAGALLCMTRMQSLISVIPLLGLAILLYKWSARCTAVCLAPFGVLMAIYFWVQKTSSGSYLGYLVTFGDFYQAAELKGNPAAAVSLPHVGTFDYLFKQHSFFNLVSQTLAGYGQIFFNPVNPYNRIYLDSHYARSWNLYLLPFFWVGCVACLGNRMGRWLLVFLMLFLNGLPFFQGIFREPRLLFHIEPFVLLITAAGWEWIVRLRKNTIVLQSRRC